MASLHLGFQVVRGFVGGELRQLLGQHQLPGQVEQQIGHLVPDGGAVSRADGVVQLVDLLDQVRSQGVAGLDPIPGAPIPEVTNHRHRASKR